MTFNFEQRFDHADKDNRSINDLEGDDIRKILTAWQSNLYDLIAGEQQNKLAQHGFVVLMNGSWGSGKTTAVRTLLKGVVEKCGEKHRILRVEYSFLPFGNVNESIADFVNELTGLLWEENWLDMRKEAKCLIASATPADDTKYTLGLNTGLFTANIQRSQQKQTFTSSEQRLYERFKALSEHKRAVVITIDDIDRLQPSEIVPILRLIEKLRKLPNLIIIVPVHKTIIANAVQEHLKLPRNIDAQTFLRKATDAEFSINNKLATLKKVFIEGWDDIDKNNDLLELLDNDPAAAQSKALQDENAKTISALCWYTLLHISILEEAIIDIAENSGDGEGNAVNRIFSPDSSEYLADINNLLKESRQRRAGIYPVSYNEGAKTIVPAGSSVKYQPLAELGTGSTTRRMKLLSHKVDYNDEAIYADVNLIASISGSNGSIINNGQYDNAKRYILFEMFMPRLISTSYEPLITENVHGYYKLRDVKELSQKIRSKILAIHDEDKTGEHYNSVKLIFRTVRESFEEFRQ